MDFDSLCNIPPGVQTRWATAENPDAAVGAGGTSNFGRKGSACRRPFPAGETFTLARAEGPGTVRRFWITMQKRVPETLRGIILRYYWDGAEKPAVEVPIGDFCCQPLGRCARFENALFDNPEGRSFNCRVPMPFKKGFKITASNESGIDIPYFFYEVNFTLGDTHGPDTLYFHSHYRRENPTTLRRDFEILPAIQGRGRFLGATVGVIADQRKYGSTW